MKIEDFMEKRSIKIAEAVKEKYGEPLSVFENMKIQKYIYERALHEATSFLLSESDTKFDEDTIKFLRARLEMRLKNPKDVKKISPEELLASVIKIDVADFLLEKYGIVI